MPDPDLPVTGWRIGGVEDDMRPRMFAAADGGHPFALATIVAADGGPRPVGAQMVVTRAESWGFLSGGCIEDDVARNARLVLESGVAMRLVYGRGSPFIDIRLPCGGRLEVLIERVLPGDPRLADLRHRTAQRAVAEWPGEGFTRRYDPPQRLRVVGSDAFALALAAQGAAIGWDTALLVPFAPASDGPFGLAVDRRALAEALAEAELDPWTAVAVATHEMEADEAALVPALASRAGYVGVVGSRRKLGERLARLAAAGLSEAQLARLHAPIGLDIGARSPWDMAVAVAAQIIASRGAGTDVAG